jgi:hypothetical protein
MESYQKEGILIISNELFKICFDRKDESFSAYCKNCDYMKTIIGCEINIKKGCLNVTAELKQCSFSICGKVYYEDVIDVIYIDSNNRRNIIFCFYNNTWNIVHNDRLEKLN